MLMPKSNGSNFTISRVVLLAILMLIIGAGCSGNKRRTIRGTLQLDGKPLSSCIIRIHGNGDGLFSALVRPDGTFAITDVQPGEIRVTVVPLAPGGGTPSDDQKGKVSGKKGQPVAGIPLKYQNPNTTDLVFTLDDKTQDLAIDLKR
jgi:hypothetical protein